MDRQETLKRIKASLNERFSFLTEDYAVANKIAYLMREHYPYSQALFTDDRCKFLYKTVAEDINKHVDAEYKKVQDEISNELEMVLSLSVSGGANFYGYDGAKSLLWGAGVGAIAALALGGPIGWFAAGAAGLFGLFSSESKKRELISDICTTARSMNDEAKTKILEVLNKLIIPAAKPTNYIPLAPRQIEQVEVLTPEQLEIKNFIEQRGIRYLVHFTSANNYNSISQNGLVSPKEAYRRNLLTRVNDDGLSAGRVHSLQKSTANDYISFSVTNLNRDLLCAYRARNLIHKAIVVYVDPRVLWKEIGKDRIYCDMNASARQVQFGNDMQAFKNMFRDNISQTKFNGVYNMYSRSNLAANEPTHPQAEILFEGYVSKKYILKIEEIGLD